MMQRCRRIGLIGRADLNHELYDGQTVKTRSMYRLLSELYGEESIVLVETMDYSRHMLRVLYSFVRCMFLCDSVVVMLSEGGRRAFFPLLYIFARFRGVHVYHNLIGGWLASNLDKYPRWVRYLNSFQVNWVEARELVAALGQRGVNNARYLPNFKYFSGGDDASLKLSSPVAGSGYRFCTFSRVVAEKGIGDAVHAVHELNRRGDGRSYRLDVYGPIDESYRSEFMALVTEFAEVEYCGCVAPEGAIEVLKRYFALIFPTRWELEGIPGSIIDALTAGIPVIASKWRYYDEMLTDGETGFGYQLGHPDELADTLEKLFSGDVDVQRMGAECVERSRDYAPENVAKEVKSMLGDS